MKRFEVFCFQRAGDLAQAAARDWLESARSPQSTGQPFCIALSGGRVAKTFFDALTELSPNRREALQDVHFFWADERCVPPNSSESNFGLAECSLLQPLAVPGDHIHRIRGELPPESAQLAAAEELRRVASPSDNGQPRLDLVLLGMGEDGHIASLFPGTPPEGPGEIYRVVEAVKPPPQRITLTFGALQAAREVWVLASGPGKEEALRSSLLADGRTPLGELLQRRAWTRIYTDILIQDLGRP